jgi:acyl-CoA synthetase (AMP-forming)/AMP-acid ligase II
VYGAAMVVPYEYFKPEESLAAIEAARATAVYGVPTMFIAMLDHPTRATRNLTSLRTGVMAGSPCPLEIMQRVVAELGAREITIAYGLTEASPVITQTRSDDPIELRVKTVGRPIPGFDVRLVDPATGRVLGDEEQGELCARGHGVMLGYYNMPEQTARTIDVDGWLHTGDLASRMANGYYRITGRIKDMVIRGGENIYPREIEEFLYTHPAVQDVAATPEQTRLLHKTIQAVTNDIENLSFNTAISRMMEFVNGVSGQDLRPRSILEPFVLLLAPFAPHLAEEAWELLGHNQTLAHEPWPAYDPALLVESEIEIAVQINGKVRGKIRIPADADQDTAQKFATAEPRVAENLAGKQIVKLVYVPGRLLSFVVKS